jgi:hypothetical protein
MNPAQAEEQLRVIRNLMERATIYRAISAPTALVGGILSIVASVVLSDWDTRRFIAGWLMVLVITLAANTWFIHQKARRESGKIFSPGLRLAIRTALPTLLVAAVFTGSVWVETGKVTVPVFVVATVWTLFYGLALLSTATFAPRSLIVLGWAFLISSVLAQLLGDRLSSFAHYPATFLMSLTFGLYHLVYAVCTWPRKRAAEAAQMSIE